jgi:hypothetical protein
MKSTTPTSSPIETLTDVEGGEEEGGDSDRHSGMIGLPMVDDRHYTSSFIIDL